MEAWRIKGKVPHICLSSKVSCGAKWKGLLIYPTENYSLFYRIIVKVIFQAKIPNLKCLWFLLSRICCFPIFVCHSDSLKGIPSVWIVLSLFCVCVPTREEFLREHLIWMMHWGKLCLNRQTRNDGSKISIPLLCWHHCYIKLYSVCPYISISICLCVWLCVCSSCSR